MERSVLVASSASGTDELQAQLLAWGERHRRDLPWRRTRDPWAVLVSELMLQQTQVARVVPRYEWFLAAFPTPGAAAAAPVGRILQAWAGLGYNRRALALHRTATIVVDDHAGQLPDDLPALLALPGIGPYTARAVLVFAFERHHGVLDTNAARVLARAVAGEQLGPRRAQDLADGHVPAGLPWAWNQAVLDLGAMVCTKRDPRCNACPIVDRCVWAGQGWPPPDPAVGSAGVGGAQSTFVGSDRQGRGRLVQAMCGGPIGSEALAAAAGWPDDPGRARRVADDLVAEGLAVYVDGRLELPG